MACTSSVWRILRIFIHETKPKLNKLLLLEFPVDVTKLWLTLSSFSLNSLEFTTINNFSSPLSSFMTSFEQQLQLLSRVIYAVFVEIIVTSDSFRLNHRESHLSDCGKLAQLLLMEKVVGVGRTSSTGTRKSNLKFFC